MRHQISETIDKSLACTSRENFLVRFILMIENLKSELNNLHPVKDKYSKRRVCQILCNSSFSNPPMQKPYVLCSVLNLITTDSNCIVE